MITIDQLLESVDLDFEPRWVTKDECGEIAIWPCKKPAIGNNGRWCGSIHIYCPKLKLAEFSDKDWKDCIYEVPQKTTGKIEKLGKLNVSGTNMTMNQSVVDRVVNVLNQVIDAVNELKGAN